MGMSNIIKTLKTEFLEILPVTIFFFIALHLVAFTEALILREYSVHVSTTALVTVSALVLGKAILIADKLPFINRFPNKPLIYNIVWKTFIYLLIALFLRYLEVLIPMLVKHQSWSLANQHMQQEVVWPHFWAVNIWVWALLLGYAIVRELVRAQGKREVIKLFFGF
jgi:uncharacterized membrane protein